MRRSTFLGTWALGAAMAGASLAQTPPPAVTTVSPIEVTSGLPQVGPGATFFTPEQLAEQAKEARQSQLESRDAGRACGVSRVPEGWIGDFGIGGLSAAEGQAQWDAWRATLAAEEATTALLAVRDAVGRNQASQGQFEAAERARQQAVLAGQTAQKKATIAHWRVVDLIELAEESAGSIGAIRALEDGYYHRACSYHPDGEPTVEPLDPVSTAEYNRCLDTSSGENMQQFAAEVEERSAFRDKNNVWGATVFTPRIYADLRLAQIMVREQTVNGSPVLRISGRIVNTRDSAIPVPPLWLSVTDRFGTELKSEQIMAPKGQGKIRARGNLQFTYAIDPRPPRSARTTVTFAPFHRPSEYVTASIICPATAESASSTPRLFSSGRPAPRSH